MDKANTNIEILNPKERQNPILDFIHGLDIRIYIFGFAL
jgi:hypothetical protein